VNGTVPRPRLCTPRPRKPRTGSCTYGSPYVICGQTESPNGISPGRTRRGRRGASAKRAAALAAVAAEPRPCILYESPRRVESTVSVLSQIDGSRGVVIGRELTKTHEELWRGTLFEATQWLAAGGGAGRELFTAGVDGAGPRGDSPRRKRTTRGARDDAPSQDRARALSGP